MRPIVINGTVLCDNITGIPRYVYEVISRLDKLLEGTGLDVRLAYRDDGRPLHLTGLKNIQVVPLHAVRYCYNLFVLPHYLRKNHAFFVGLASDMLMTRDSAVVLHDIRPLVMDTDRGFFRFKFWVHCLSTKWFAREVYTVSDDQRHLISDKLGIPLDKIGVTYNGWEHMNAVEPDESVFEKLPDVKKGEYFYALGSLAKHKNYKWIREVAARNPDKTFVVAGGADLAAFGKDEADAARDTGNVFYPGYVTDGENKALMQHCKAFLHPAVFEGFGIPPLEALSQGAPILLSNASCLPELYGDCARYFDPNDYEADLDALLAEPVSKPDKLLEKYSWDKTAAFWLEQIKRYAAE
ncbi:glycosyltransferase family 4 protein [Subdoligranulum sp. DSM 109015]|uniref:Glycosyltransferase family 4 protein n=1 Tax=Gemmiger gallinarum TaxID=2779354 RepID=A0ABR9R384_9FIRM|nr:glycosyltransferase family 1 protein [Gemmiger gallinarum]MBE5037584.1 glycosyltransferase family 4 protein [Gemmiger gallinarum]